MATQDRFADLLKPTKYICLHDCHVHEEAGLDSIRVSVLHAGDIIEVDQTTKLDDFVHNGHLRLHFNDGWVSLRSAWVKDGHLSKLKNHGGQLKVRLSISEHAIRLARDDDSKVHVIPLNGVTLSSLHKNPSAFVVEGLSLKALENKDQKQGRHTILTKTDSEARTWVAAIEAAIRAKASGVEGGADALTTVYLSRDVPAESPTTRSLAMGLEISDDDFGETSSSSDEDLGSTRSRFVTGLDDEAHGDDQAHRANEALRSSTGSGLHHNATTPMSEVARRIAEAGGSEFTEYATLFDKLDIGRELIQLLDERGWQDLFEGDLSSVRTEHREALKATVGRMLDSTLAPTAAVDAERTPAHKSNPTSRVRKIAKPKPQSAGATDRAKDVGRSPTDTADTSPLGIANGHDSAENNYGVSPRGHQDGEEGSLRQSCCSRLISCCTRKPLYAAVPDDGLSEVELESEDHPIV